MTCEELITGVKAADPVAMDEFHVKYLSRFYRRTSAELRCGYGPSDEAQEVALAMLACIHKAEIKQPERLAGYCNMVFNSTIAGIIRQRSRERRQCRYPKYLCSPIPDPERQLLAKERIEQVRRAIHWLSPQRQRVMRLCLAGATATSLPAAIGLRYQRCAQLKWQAQKDLRRLLA